MQYRYDAMISGKAMYTEAEAHGMVVLLCHWSNRGKDGIKKRKLVIQPRFDWSCCVSLYVWEFILVYLEDVVIWCHIAVSFLITYGCKNMVCWCLLCVWMVLGRYSIFLQHPKLNTIEAFHYCNLGKIKAESVNQHWSNSTLQELT